MIRLSSQVTSCRQAFGDFGRLTLLLVLVQIALALEPHGWRPTTRNKETMLTRNHRSKQLLHDNMKLSEDSFSRRPADTSSPIDSTRRNVLWAMSIPVAGSWPLTARAEDSRLAPLLKEVQQARSQLDAVPKLIESEQWDAVRAILITPPLSDCWTKSAKKEPLLSQYAQAVGDSPNGDELAALEAKEDLSSHLRFLDMAVYNNVFNPIKSEGETGATKQLIKSYYEDPINELKASQAALEELIKLGKS